MFYREVVRYYFQSGTAHAVTKKDLKAILIRNFLELITINIIYDSCQTDLSKLKCSTTPTPNMVHPVCNIHKYVHISACKKLKNNQIHKWYDRL